MEFSLLISIYQKEDPSYFNQAMLSVWDKQTIKPSEIILVQDGPLNEALYACIDEWKIKLEDVLTCIALEKNVGLGKALNIGLNACTHTLIARMDTDDIALANRFEKQLEIFENNNIDICGTWVSEFDTQEKNIVSYRKVPESHIDIVDFSKIRNPFNHPTVMYKKSSVLNAGNYQDMYLFEDYFLWVRMMLQGAKFYNIQESLVNMRAGYTQLQRRSGFSYALHEFRFQKKLLSLHFISHGEFFYNLVLRLGTRVLPKTFVKIIYQKIRQRN